MTINEIGKEPPGVRFVEKGAARITVWAPEAKTVEIILPDQKARHPLVAQESGFWSLLSDQIKPGDAYRFSMDQGQELPDPASLAQHGGVHGMSVATDLRAHIWQDPNWQNMELKEYIIYELHVGTFTAEGTFAGIEEKLDYLVDLGVTAIELMPVAQFPGSRNWGYDGVLPYCVQDSYGGAHGLQHLVDACHQKGLAVILDVVYNHIGPEGNILAAYGPYFTEKYHTPWGNAVNFDDAWSDGVRQFFVENALMWFRDFHIDALRLDAVHAIKDFSPIHLLQEIKIRVDELMQETNKVHYLIVEMDLNDPRFINPLSKGGLGMDAQWIDEFHHALRVSSGQEKSGYYADFEPIESLGKSYRDAYVYDGQFSAHRKRKFGVKTSENSGEQFIVFSQNHDQVGNRMLGERTSQLVNYEMQKLLAGAVLVSPFLPMLFMGEEWSEPNPFQYFVSHTDPELAEMVRTGRKKEFAAFHLEGEAPDPMSEQTFHNSKLQWAMLEKEPHQKMFRFYKQLIALRKALPAWKEPDRNGIEVSSDTLRQIISVMRTSKEQQIIAFLNFSDASQQVQLPENGSEWSKVIASSDPEWNGLLKMPEKTGSGALLIQPQSFTMYSNGYE